MGFSIKGFFKTGSLWATLEDSLEVLKAKLYRHSEMITDLKSRDIVLLNQIRDVKNENRDLNLRLENLEEIVRDAIVMRQTEELKILHRQQTNLEPSQVIKSDSWDSKK